MDVELSIIAEKLQLRLPHTRGEKNDHRMCGDFLEGLKSAGKKCFQKKNGRDYPIYADGLELLDKADKLLVSWGNKGIPPPQAALFGERFAKKHVALRLALRSVDAGRSSGRG